MGNDHMAANLFQPSLSRATDSNGNPISGAQLYFYATNTTTPATWYTDDTGNVPGVSPAVADSTGAFSPIYLDPAITYRIVLKSAGGASTIWDVDPVRGFDETQLYATAEEAVAAAASATASSAAASSASTAAAVARTGAEAARDAANSAVAASQDYFPAARSHVPQGAALGAGTISAAGTGGTGGTFALAFTGGNFAVNPTGTFTVAGGVVTAINITGAGLYIGGSITKPTLSFAASAGLTGASGTFNTVFLKTAGEYWLTDTSPASNYLSLFQNVANAAVEVDAQFDPMSAGAAADAAASLDARLDFFAVPGGEYALTFGAPGGPIFAGITEAEGHWDFTGVRTLPIAAPDGTVTATVTADTGRSGFMLACYNAATRALLFGLQDDGTFVASVSVAEVTAARGTAADLDARLSRGLTAAGSPRLPVQNLARLRAYRAGISTLAAGGSALVHVLVNGDSWFDVSSYGLGPAIARFLADSGLTCAGPGWIGVASSLTTPYSPHGSAQNTGIHAATVTRDASWTDLFRSADVTPGTAQNFPGYDACQSTANGATITIACTALATATAVTLYCTRGSSIERSWDGTNWAAVTVAGGSGATSATISLTGQTGTLRLRAASGSVIAGVFVQTASSGVIFSKLSSSGSTAAQQAGVQANADYQTLVAALPGAAKLLLCQMGLNDAKGTDTAADVQADIAAIVAGYRTAAPATAAIVLAQPNTDLNTAFAMTTLSPLLRAWAEDNDCAFLDWQPFFGSPGSGASFAAYANSGGTPPLLTSDNRHPLNTGTNFGATMVAGALANVFLSPLRSN